MFQRIQGVGLGLLIATAVVALAAFGTSFAQNSPQGEPLQDTSFVYQGRLTEDGLPADGLYNFTVRFFDSLEQETPNYTFGTLATVTNGQFSFLVSPDVYLDGDRVFIEVLVVEQGSLEFATSLGRQELTPAPYAVYAMTAGELSSEGAAGFIQNGTTQQPTSNFNISGNGTAGGTLSANVFALNGVPIMRNFGVFSLAVGTGAGNDTATGFLNTLLGGGTGSSLTTGSANTAAGSGALASTSTGTSNAAFGASSLPNLTTGMNNVAVGKDAGFHLTVQSGNTFLGNEAGFDTSAGANTAVGFKAGRHFTGTENVFVGSEAGEGTWLNSTGSQNVAVGTRSGEALTTGTGNTLLGTGAGDVQTTGSSNAFVGFDSGATTTTGSENTFIGPYAGLNNVNGYNNVAVGTAAGFSSSNLTYATAIGSGSQAIASDQVQLGRNGTGTVRIGSLTTTGVTQVCVTSDKVLATCSSSLRYKTNLADYTGGLDILEQLRPVTFDWKSDGTHDLGFVAEDVAAIDPLLATYLDGEVEGVKYDRISAVLVNSVMEQQAQIDALASGVIPADDARLDAIEAAIAGDSGSNVPGWLYALAGAVIGSLLLPGARKVARSFQ